MRLEVKKLVDDAKIPTYSHEGDAGFDLYSAEDATISPLERRTIKTGIAMAIPEGYVGLIWDKSGLASKYGLHKIAGVVDSGYRGEIGVVMVNLGEDDFSVKKYDKIAQMLIQPVFRVEFEEVQNLSETSRGTGGFGSTGRK